MNHSDMEALDQSIDSNKFINTQSKIYLVEVSKWTKFLSILGFIMVGIIVLVALFAGSLFAQANLPFPSIVISIIYLAVAAFYFFPIMYLFKFSKNTKTACESEDENVLTLAFENLLNHFKFIGIVAIIFISLYVLLILGTIIMAMVR